MPIKSIEKMKIVREMWFFFTSIIVIGLDQLTKHMVRANMALGQSIPETGFFRITYGTNTGGVFGILANQTFLITVAAVIAVVVILLYSRHKMAQSKLVKLSLGLLLGGSVGNLIDRVRFGEVTDFIDIGIGGYHWPAFNVADSAIVVGVILLIFHVLFRMNKGKAGANELESKD